VAVADNAGTTVSETTAVADWGGLLASVTWTLKV
jgi:hypothetical protein